jgi:hypothetical protein
VRIELTYKGFADLSLILLTHLVSIIASSLPRLWAKFGPTASILLAGIVPGELTRPTIKFCLDSQVPICPGATLPLNGGERQMARVEPTQMGLPG